MLRSDKNIDSVFKQGLAAFEATPSEGVWEGIESGLNGQVRNKRLILFWRVSAAASIVLAAFLGWLFVNNSPSHPVETALVVSVPEVVLENNQVSNNSNNTKINEKSSNNTNTTNPELDNVNVSAEPSYLESKILNNQEPLLADNSNVVLKEESNQQGLIFQMIDGKNDVDIRNSEEINSRHLKVKQHKEYYPLYAYDEVKEEKAKMQMLIGGSMSSSYNYRESSGAPVQATSTNYSESGINTLGGGINVRLEGKSRWSIETGVLFAQLGQEVSSNAQYQSDMVYDGAFMKSSIMPSKAFSNSMGNIKYSAQSSNSSNLPLNEIGMTLAESNYVNTSAEALRQTLDYIEVPVMARYKIIDGFPILSVAGGLSSNFLVGNNAYLLEDGKRINIGETEDIKPLSWSSSLGLGLELPITKVIRLNIEPRMKYYLESVSTNPDYDFQPYSFVVFGGVTFIL